MPKSHPKLQFFLYAFFMVGAAILGMLKLTVYAKLLEVEEFGLYSLVLSSYLFVMYAGSFGLNEALVKEGSIAYGKKKFKRIRHIRDLALCYSSLGVIFVSFMILLCSWLFVQKAMFQDAVYLMIILAFATLEFNLVSSYVRVNHKFTLFSKMLFFKSLLVILLAWFIAPEFGVYGLVILESIIFIIFALFVLKIERVNIDFKRVFKANRHFRQAVKQGMPVMVSTVIRNLSLSLDRWVIVATLGLIALAKYAFAMILYQVAMVGIGFISTILGTRWLSSFGADSDLNRMFFKIKQIILFIGLVGVLLYWPFSILLNYTIDVFYPQYSDESVFVTVHLVYFGVILLTFTYLLDWLFIASSNEKILLKLSVFSLVLTAVFILYAYLMHAEIYIYAFIFLLVRAINLALCLFVVARFLKLKILSF